MLWYKENYQEDLPRRTASEKVLRDKGFKIASDEQTDINNGY